MFVGLRRMANKASKGRQKPAANKGKGLVTTGGPKKGFARKEISKPARKSAEGVVAAAPKLSKNGVPLTICVVPFHESVFNNQLIDFLATLVNVDSDVASPSGVAIKTGSIPSQPRSRVQLVIPNHRENIQVILDAAKAADVLLCVFPNDAAHDRSCFDPLGYETLTALRMQGLPPLVIGTMLDTSDKKIGMKTVQRFFFSEFSQDKAKFLMPSASIKEGDQAAIGKQLMGAITAAFSGSLSSTVSESLALRRMRGYMLIDSWTPTSTGEVSISGFARGAGFSINSAVHLTGYPHTFRVSRIEIIDSTGGMNEVVRVIEPTPEEEAAIAESLAPLQPAEIQEQTWPTDEELAAAEKNQIRNRKMKRVLVPAGTGAEMAEWLGQDMDDDEEIVGADSMEAAGHHVMDGEDLGGEEIEGDDVDDDDEALKGMFDWDKVDEADAACTPTTPQFEERSREDMDFVDEVDTPQNMTARERFQKYRGLKSLRNGNWDPYEELPAEYSQIHEFQDIQFTTKQAFAALAEGGAACVNKYCRLHLVPVAGPDAAPVSPDTAIPLVASSAGAAEAKVTVVHCRLTRLPEALDLIIKSKDTVTVQVGFRRMEVRPIFSEVAKYSASTGTCPIQRMYRQLPSDTGASIMMSFYAPAVFGTSPALVFHSSGRLALWGSVAGCAPNRPVLVKRATLTGYPFRVHQTKAVCRFMFFNPQDIDWFTPVELTTKKGLRGHIIESLGTHGYMKCRFNGQLTSDDVICMHLYKRVYPKWHPATWGMPLTQ